MPGARHEFAPAMTIEQAINGAVIHRVSDTGLKGAPDLCRRRDLAGLSPGKERSEELLLFFSASDTHADALPCLAFLRLPVPSDCRSR